MTDLDTDDLVRRARTGDESAIPLLFDRHRQRLRRMVSVRMDDRLAARFDPSDVIQETMIDAVRKLPEYLRKSPLPFYPWLRQIALNQLIDLHREHVIAERRTVNRETPFDSPFSSQSQNRLADQLLDRHGLPSSRIVKEELILRLQNAIARLTSSHREVLILRHLEGLSVSEVAQILKITETAATSRHFRALARLKELLGQLEM